ncbi:hypothetical protein [Nitrosopumilus sp. S6]
MNSSTNTKSLQIMIRADGNSKIGMGHIFRTMNLASVLVKKNHQVMFLTTTSFVQSFIKKNGFLCKLIPKQLSQQKIFFSKIKCDIFILDKKTEFSSLLDKFTKISKVFFAIDYVGKNKDRIPFGVNILYPNSGPKNGLSSLDYTILKNNFKKSKKIKKSVSSLLLLQGGADQGCFIPKIINILNESEQFFRITTVIGPRFSCWNELKVAKQNCVKPLKILKNVNNMYSEMVKHDVAISAGGMTLLELCKCGIPSLTMGSEKQEEETAIFLESNGFGINLGFSKHISKTKLLSKLNHLIDNFVLRKSMNSTGPKLIDGKGTKRIVDILENHKNLI